MTVPTTPPRADWSAVRPLFEAASACTGAEREALLADPAHDHAVVAEVRSLLAHAAAPSLLDQPPVGRPPVAQAGLRLGAWRLVEPLGSGGMGEVWAAERADGRYQGEAAVKLLKRGLDSDAVLARFAQEQQALARLSHPHIARLLDAGLSPDGVPYFVMERVRGRPIDESCAALPLDARLRLFLQLAAAVSHAHRHLLVHRDLKPGNVLVDEAGQVKLLDFGIAKALAADDPGATAPGGLRPFTPHYASPEQVRGEPVSTATDLYSLGVLLYVLLTGERPYGRQATTPHDAARAVLEEEPTRPSSLARPAPGWEATRSRLQGDLDNIVLKALEKPVERRYASVDALAADVQAYLDGYPVGARAAGWPYRAGKFVRRHRLPVALAATAVLALGVGLGTALVQAGEARRARDAAEQRLSGLKALTRDVVFRYGDAVTYLPGGLQVKENMMVDAAQRLEAFATLAGDDPGLQGDVAGAWARLAYVQADENSASLGKPEDALRNADRAIALGMPVQAQRAADADFMLWLSRAHTARGHALRQADRKPEALAAFEAAVDVLERALAQRPGDRTLRTERATLRHATGQLLYQPGTFHLDRPEAALQQLAQARAELAALEAEAHDVEVIYQLGTVIGAIHKVHLGRDELEAAIATGSAAVLLHQRCVDEDPSSVVYLDGLMTEANNVGFILVRAERPAEALPHTRTAREAGLLLARQHGPASKWARFTRLYATTHGRALAGVGRHAEAVAMFEEAESEWRRMQAEAPAPSNEMRRHWVQVQRARSLAALGRRAEAQALLEPAWRWFDALRDEPSLRYSALLNSGEAALALHALAPAGAWRAKALAAYRRAAELKPLVGEYASALRRAGG